MKILFSPSKKQDIQTIVKGTEALFFQDADFLLSQLRRMSVKEIMNKSRVSESIAQTLYSSYQAVPVYGNALASYTGTAFAHIGINNWKSKEWSFAQKHLRILSGLYGSLRPKDLIEHHRLDVADKTLDLNLYHYWKMSMEREFSQEDVILNLASGEYAKMIQPWYQGKFITVEFLVEKGASLTSVSVFSKQQRGKLLNYVIQHRLSSFESLKKYESDGYVYQSSLSDDHHYVFVKS